MLIDEPSDKAIKVIDKAIVSCSSAFSWQKKNMDFTCYWGKHGASDEHLMLGRWCGYLAASSCPWLPRRLRRAASTTP
jgi:hypothetical protein